MNSYMMLHDADLQTETVGLHFLCDSFEHITEVLREVLHCFGFCCSAKVSRALCSHEVGTRVGGFLRPLADLRNLRCRGSKLVRHPVP